MGRVQGKVAIVTGAASGFGAATAKLLITEGAYVVGTDKNADALKALASHVGNGFTPFTHDVTKEQDWARVVDETMSRHGKINILMNNAGVFGSGAPQDLENISFEE